VTDRISLRARLLLAVSAITLVALSLADVFVFSSIRSYLYNQVDVTLETSHRAVEAMAANPGGAMGQGSFFVPSGHPPGGGGNGPPGGPSGSPGQGGSAFCAVGRESAPGMFIEVLSSKGNVVTGTAGREECPSFQPGSASYSPKLPTVITGFSRDPLSRGELTSYFTVGSSSAGGPAFRVRASELIGRETLVVATPISNITATLSRLVVVEIVVTAGALLAAALLGAWLVRVGLRPLRDVERTAEAISGGDLMHRAPNANPRTEVGHLATAFNVMLGRIEGLFSDVRASESRLRRFVGDASHELRTPIAAVSAYAQLFREGAASRPEDLERAMSGIERESARMARLVEDLLALARLDERNLVEAEPVELVGLVVDASGTAIMVGPGWPVNIVADDAVEVLGDAGALRRVVDNLLSNVRAHTPEGTATTVTVGRTGGEAFIEIADNGPGITEEQARLVFERFVRLDPSRSRQTGGAGLGLAIVASIVDAHGGHVAAAPRAGGGAVFRVTIPALEFDPEVQVPSPAPAVPTATAQRRRGR
jgi:two-component system OmpR family sensor kinase